MPSLNRAFTRLNMRRRYESWFLRMGLVDGSGALWLRYLLTNPGRGGCPSVAGGAPVQVWATWFPREGRPETFIQEFPLGTVRLASSREPFRFEAGPNRIDESSCRGAIEQKGRRVSWDLRYRSSFAATLSNKGWIGFSRTPHSDAIFSGEILLDGNVFRGDPLATGVQGHNCGFRHRHFWMWTHACVPRPDGRITTFEALVYEMPLGLVFRKAILWHDGQVYAFRKLSEAQRDSTKFSWNFEARSDAGSVAVEVDGGGPSLHRLPYAKTDCSGTFEVANNSRSRASLQLKWKGLAEPLVFTTEDNAVLEMTGSI